MDRHDANAAALRGMTGAPAVFEGDRERQIASLQGRVAELESALRTVTLERDAAREALRRNLETDARAVAEERAVGSCMYCDGEGIIWVHDFRMDCKRCNGTGRGQAG
jgi:hypothetical protein